MRIQGTGEKIKVDTIGWSLFCLSVLIGIGAVWLGNRFDAQYVTRAETLMLTGHPLHFVAEMLSVLVCFSVFLVAVYSYRYIPNSKLLTAGYVFFATGLLDIIHLVGDTGYAIFTAPTSLFMRSTAFHLLSRSIYALGLLLVAIVAEKRLRPVNMSFWFVLEISVLSLLIWLVAWNPMGFAWIRDGYYAQDALWLQRFTIVLLVVTMLMTIRQYQIKPDRLQIIMAAALALLICVEVLSMMVVPNSFHGDGIAHLLKLAGQALLFDVFYVHGIRRPFILLSEARDSLNHYANELDREVEVRTMELKTANNRLMADMEVARDVQRAMLPTQLPQGETVRFAAGYVPAERLSGDFYHVFRVDSNRFGLCVGDVAGHGVSAAMLTVFAFQSVQSLQEESKGAGVILPSFVLKHLYEGFNSANFQDEHYMVLLYAVYNTETGILAYSNGGLNTTPFRLRPDGSLQPLDTEGMAICKMGEIMPPNYRNKQLLLFPGDKLVLYTDGLVEAKSPEGEVYSLERLSELLRSLARLSAEQIKEAVLADVKAFTQLESPDDDITMLIMEVILPF